MAIADAMAQAQSHGFERHGGRIDDACRAFPDSPQPWLDLSTGISPIAWRPPADLSIDVRELPPTSALLALEAEAARMFGAAPCQVVAVPGSELALRLVNTLDLPNPITAAAPSYGTHLEVAAASMAWRELVLGGADGTILIANPNNPDGRLLDRASARRLAAQQAERRSWLVVDEAFADSAPANSLAALVTPTSPLIVLRSFGKFYGLAGLRLGFVIGPDAVVGRLRALLGDWPIASHALAYGLAAYRDDAWADRHRAHLSDLTARLDTLLATHGLIATGDCPLFRLVEHSRARDLFERLGRAGILTRPFADRPDWLRFGLPATDADFARLDSALALD